MLSEQWRINCLESPIGLVARGVAALEVVAQGVAELA